MSPPFPCCPVSCQCPWKKPLKGKKNIVEIKLSDKSIVSKKGWKGKKGKPTSQLDVSNVSRGSFAKTFRILLFHEVKTQKLIHNTDSYVSKPAMVLPNISSFLYFKLVLCFLLCFRNCEHAVTAQRAPIFFSSVSLLLSIKNKIQYVLYLPITTKGCVRFFLILFRSWVIWKS